MKWSFGSQKCCYFPSFNETGDNLAGQNFVGLESQLLSTVWNVANSMTWLNFSNCNSSFVMDTANEQWLTTSGLSSCRLKQRNLHSIHCDLVLITYLERHLVEFCLLQRRPIVVDIQPKLHSRCVDVHHHQRLRRQHCEMELIFLGSIHLRDEHELQIAAHLQSNRER